MSNYYNKNTYKFHRWFVNKANARCMWKQQVRYAAIKQSNLKLHKII